MSSDRVLPCELTPGISSTHPIHQPSSCLTTAVKWRFITCILTHGLGSENHKLRAVRWRQILFTINQFEKLRTSATSFPGSRIGKLNRKHFINPAATRVTVCSVAESNTGCG